MKKEMENKFQFTLDMKKESAETESSSRKPTLQKAQYFVTFHNVYEAYKCNKSKYLETD